MSGDAPRELPQRVRELQSSPAEIDVDFDAATDTPAGRDPDSHSPMLRRYHKLLWSKPLPDGTVFSLTDDVRRIYLLHESALGRFGMSSDSIINQCRGPMAHFRTEENLAAVEAAKGARWGSTIGQSTIFPGFLVDGKPTINGARGMHPRIRDRFDLTLECIRRHYLRDTDHPLAAVLTRYDDFFVLFGTFANYVEFFLFQDLIDEHGAVRFYLPFEGFDKPALPRALDGYLTFLRAQAAFEAARSQRIRDWCSTVLQHS